MVITCEQCTTRFQLDDSRVPEQGVRVRCSRCKHAFFVKPEARTDDDPLDRVVAQALEAEAAEQQPGNTQPLGPPLGDAGEADWQFNHDMEGGHDAAMAAAQHAVDGLLGGPPPEAIDDDAGPLGGSDDVEEDIDALLGGASQEASTESAPRAQPEEELGSPDEWDFGSDARGDEDATLGEVPLNRVELVTAGSAEALHELPEHETDAPPVAAWLRHVGNAIGWTATAALGVALLHVTLQPPAPMAAPAVASGPGVGLVDVAARRVDNVVAGPVTVIEGRFQALAGALRPPGARFAVRLFDARGALLADDVATLGPALPLAALREEDPSLLRERLEREAATAAWQAAPPRASRPFHALIESLPAGAARFDVVAVPVERPLVPLAGPSVGSEGAAEGAQESD